MIRIMVNIHFVFTFNRLIIIKILNRFVRVRPACIHVNVQFTVLSFFVTKVNILFFWSFAV